MHITAYDFNPGVLAGITLSFLPRPLLRQLMDVLMRRMHDACPSLRGRLVAANGKSFALIIGDMPFNLLLHVKDGLIHCILMGKQEAYASDVVIHADSRTLLALLEGSEDGDALFFSRDLQVAGDTEALLVLRNALDSEPVDIQEICYSVAGYFAPAVKRLAKPVEALAARFMRDVQSIHRHAVGPLLRQQQEWSQRLLEMERRLAVVENAHARRNARKAGGHEG